MGGYFTGTADFDPGAGSVQVNSAGDKDAYVLKLTQTTVGLLEGESSASLQVYPNPANALIHVKVVEPTTVSILNALGQECLRRVVTQSEVIHLTGFEAGIYIVKDLNTGKALKFIKQ
ncbi:MAG TPA: T9SS type A sorting domain-containing protein [Bacteroidia bacterium]|nr:T9SS type A sorting domain-containing protein [Bacteroidia bacterium]